MRAEGDRKQVRVEYNALIHQLTGEDWSDVKLTLSTASPALSAAGPGLAPFHVTLMPEAATAPNAPGGRPVQQAAEAYGRGLSKGQVLDQLRGMNSQRVQFEQQAGNSIAFAEQNRFNWNLNDVAYSFQQLELNGDATTLSVLRGDGSDEDEGPSLSYQLAGAVSLASRSDQQMVRIVQSDMKSRFYHVAVPVLTSYVYREAELMNSSDEDLLAGPITVYLDGRFVGRGEIPTVARGQTFVVGFGADPQLRARRELAEKKDDVQGGNRETKFEYPPGRRKLHRRIDARPRRRPPAPRRKRGRHPRGPGRHDRPDQHRQALRPPRAARSASSAGTSTCRQAHRRERQDDRLPLLGRIRPAIRGVAALVEADAARRIRAAAKRAAKAIRQTSPG